MLNDATVSCAICAPRTANACGITTNGFTLDISAKTGIGCGRFCAMLYSAIPPSKEPVKPTA